MFRRYWARHSGVPRGSCEAHDPIGDEGKSGKLRGRQSQVSGVGVGKIRRAQKVEEEARRAISDREHGEKLPLQTAALLERVQQARQGKKNQGVIEAEIAARPRKGTPRRARRR